MKAGEKITKEVVGTVESLLNAYEKRDVKKIMALYTPDPDTTALGTNLDQFLIGPDAIRRAYEEDFEAFSKFGLKMTTQHVSAEGPVAWLAAVCHAFFEIDGEEVESQGRLTAVLVRRERAWRLVQSHLSFPSDESGAEKPLERL